MPHDGRGARNLRLSAGKIALVVGGLVGATTCVVWLGWKLGELIAGI